MTKPNHMPVSVRGSYKKIYSDLICNFLKLKITDVHQQENGEIWHSYNGILLNNKKNQHQQHKCTSKYDTMQIENA